MRWLSEEWPHCRIKWTNVGQGGCWDPRNIRLIGFKQLLLYVHKTKMWLLSQENLVAQGFKRSSQVFGLDTVHKTGQYGQVKHISRVSQPYWYQNSCLRVSATAWATSRYFRTSLQLLLASVLPDSPVDNPKVNKAYLVWSELRNTMLTAVRNLRGRLSSLSSE